MTTTDSFSCSVSLFLCAVEPGFTLGAVIFFFSARNFLLRPLCVAAALDRTALMKRRVGLTHRCTTLPRQLADFSFSCYIKASTCLARMLLLRIIALRSRSPVGISL